MEEYLKNIDYGDVCQRCGICCGSEDGDPCIHLKKTKDNKYYCEIYKNRLGPQKTVNNNDFYCVPIEEALRSNPELRKKCAYAKKVNYDKKKK